MRPKEKPLIYIAYANKPKAPLPALETEFKEVRSILRRKMGNDFEPLFDELATHEKLKEVLQGNERQRLEFFAYSGHANLNALELSDEDAYIHGLAGMLGDCKNLKVVFLNGCSTRGMVNEILGQGVKVVIATYAPIHDSIAKEFAIAFFKRLAENNCVLGDAFDAAKDAVLIKRPETEFLDTRGLVNVSGDKRPLWGIFYKEENENYLGWKFPIVQDRLHPSLALASSQLGGEEKSLLAMILHEKDLEELPKMPEWQEASQPANLCLLWGVCRHAFLGFYLATEEGESLNRLHEALAWSEVLFSEHCNDQISTPLICWLQIDDIASIRVPRSEVAFGQFLNDQNNALAKALSVEIQNSGNKPPNIRIGIVSKANRNFQWSYIEEWVTRFPDFSFVIVLTKDDLQHDLKKKLTHMLDHQRELKRECFFVLEKPNFISPPSQTNELNDDKLYFAKKMGSIISETDSKEKPIIRKFVEEHQELMSQGNLFELVRFEKLFLPQLLEEQPERNLPTWIQACLEEGNNVVLDKLFQHIGESSARWDAFVLVAKHNERWLRLAAEDYVRQPELYLAMLRRAFRFPDEREGVFNMIHQFLYGGNCASTCKEIKELFEVLQKTNQDLLEHLTSARLSQWICFSKSGANLPNTYFSTQSGQLRSREPDFWWRIFRLPLRASLLMEIQSLDEEKKKLFGLIKDEKDAKGSRSFSQKARRSLIVIKT